MAIAHPYSKPGREDDPGHQQHLLPQIPPSPTLTDPDMILPFEGSERESSTPSPPFSLPSVSQLQTAYGMRPQSDDPNLATSLSGNNNNSNNRTQKANFSRRTWAHDGNDLTNRRLSAIGEEEAASSGVFPVHLSVPAEEGEMGIPDSPLLPEKPGANGARDAAGWSSSSSTVSGASEADGSLKQNGHAASREGEELDFSGENHTSLDHNAPSTGEVSASASPSMVGTSMVPVAEGSTGDEFSSAILGSEAERILDNAKKRLTLMEGNLTKARSSVRLTPSPSPSLSGGLQPLGLGQPVGGLYRSISRGDRKASAALRPRPTYTSARDAPSNRHSRVYSDLNLSSAYQSTLSSPETKLSRSASAMGSSGGLNNDERSFRYEPTRAYLTHRASVSSTHGSSDDKGGIPAVQEEETSDSLEGLGISNAETEPKISNIEDFNTVYPSSDPPSRTQSQMQVRDLQDQMKGLHIKISTLKVRAQEDGLRRRSIQNLRTPSPLTAADPWLNNDLRYKEIRKMNSRLSRGVESAQVTPQSDATSTFDNRPAPTDTSKPTDTRSVVTEIEDGDDSRSVVESVYQDAEEGSDAGDSTPGRDQKALDEMLSEPLDEEMDQTLEAFPPVPGSVDATPHEDRADAFDYEHFILHSALGNYAQTKLRRPSTGSTASVETTRPIYNNPPEPRPRADSAASQSTMASFATASEGEHSSDEDDIQSVMYWDQKFNDELRGQGKYDSDEDGETDRESMATPRGGSRQSNGDGDGSDNAQHQHQHSRPWSTSATPTSLVSSLISTVRATSSPRPESGDSGIDDDDTRSLEQLFQSLGSVCKELQSLTTSAEPDDKAVRVLRRRLDAARRVLDGELDA